MECDVHPGLPGPISSCQAQENFQDGQFHRNPSKVSSCEPVRASRSKKKKMKGGGTHKTGGVPIYARCCTNGKGLEKVRGSASFVIALYHVRDPASHSLRTPQGWRGQFLFRLCSVEELKSGRANSLNSLRARRWRLIQLQQALIHVAVQILSLHSCDKNRLATTTRTLSFGPLFGRLGSGAARPILPNGICRSRVQADETSGTWGRGRAVTCFHFAPRAHKCTSCFAPLRGPSGS